MNYRFMTDEELVRFVDSKEDVTPLERLLANRLDVRLSKARSGIVNNKEEVNEQQQAFGF